MSPTDGRPSTAREWRLVRRPSGSLQRTDLDLVEVGVPAPRPGDLTVVNTHLSVDPYLRGRMDDVPSYLPPFALDAPLDAGAVGVVLESRSADFAEGDVVEHFLGLREVAVAEAAAFSKIDLAGRRPEVYLGTLGSTGLTAWLASTVIAPVRAGDTVMITGAAGAVGGLAGQLARLRGAGRVIGSAGTAAKVTRLVDELGFDDAFDYHDGTAADLLDAAVPNGIDRFIDNVGGEQLAAAIDRMNLQGMIALVGMASQYDGREQHAFRNLYALITRRISVRGFLVLDHLDRMAEFRREVGDWLDQGKIVHQETVLPGIESFPDALRAVLTSGGSVSGKTVLELRPPASG